MTIRVQHITGTNNTAAIAAAKLFYYQLPFSQAISFNGQKVSAREGLILQLTDSNKQLRYGEISPLPGFSQETLQQAKNQIIQLVSKNIGDLTKRNNLYPSVQFGLDAALAKLPFDQRAIQLDTIPLLQGDNHTLLNQYIALAHPTRIKLKVARQDIAEDILLFNQLSELNPQLKIRCDANQQWSRQQASFFFKNINQKALDYIEEPTATHQDNLQLAEQFDIALALDETLQDSRFIYQQHKAISALILKPTLIGSLSTIDKFIDIAAQHKLQVHISSSFESILGIQQLTALAHRYQKRCSITLGIDTLKYFQPGLLTDSDALLADIQKLECAWNSN